MKKKECDEILKTEIKNNLHEISTDKNLFEDAWRNREIMNIRNERRYFVMGRKKIAALALGACILAGGISLGFSPSVRANVNTLFGLDNDGNVVEETEETLDRLNSTIKMDDTNQKDVEDLLGFKIKFPKKVSNYTSVCTPTAGISIKDVRNKDMDDLEDKLMNTSDIKSTTAELRKDHDVSFNVGVIYEKQYRGKYLSMIIDQQKCDTVGLSQRQRIKSNEEIEGIKCTVYEYTNVHGNEDVERGEDGAITSIKTDKTKRPETDTRQNIVFCYNGIQYTISGDYKENNDEDEMTFVKDYIDILKSGK